jgi:hypothetical protein
MGNPLRLTDITAAARDTGISHFMRRHMSHESHYDVIIITR